MPIRFGETKVPSQMVATWPEYAAVRNLELASYNFV